MRRCAKSNITFSDTLKKAKLEFQENFSRSTFYKHARENGIYFVVRNGGIDLESVDKERLKIIKKYKHLRTYRIRDIIIEELGSVKYKEPEIRKIVNKILTEEANKKGAIKPRPKFSSEVDEIIKNTHDLLSLSELKEKIKKDEKTNYNVLDLKERISELNII